jgi:cytochrome P450
MAFDSTDRFLKTTALLTFSLYMLIEHPGITRRLREEILLVVGPKGMPSHDAIRDMKYLRAFLNGAYFCPRIRIPA